MEDSTRAFSHTKDQFTNMKARQCGVSSSLRTFHATACSYDTGRPMLDTQTPPGRYAKPCCIILGYSVQSAFRPSSSRIFSSEMSWRAIRVVSSMSRPAWLAKVNTGAAFREQHMIESECCQSAFKEASVHWVSARSSSAPVWNLKVLGDRDYYISQLNRVI